MNKTMTAILERVLSEELGRQHAWREQDISNGFDGKDRDAVIADIKSFMKENSIDFTRSYFYDGYYKNK